MCVYIVNKCIFQIKFTIYILITNVWDILYIRNYYWFQKFIEIYLIINYKMNCISSASVNSLIILFSVIQ